MELNFAFLANSAEVTGDGRFFVLGGGIDGLSVHGVPAYVPALAIVASIHFPPNECGHDYELRVTISLPDGNDLGFRASTLLEARVPPEAPDHGPNLKVVFGLFGIYLPQRGRYRINFFVGDRPIGDVELNVAEVQQVANSGEQRR